MSLKNDRYSCRTVWSEEDQEYAGLCVEFPSLSWLANTPEEALAGIRRVVAKAVVDLKKSGETPPPPISGRTFSGNFIVRVPPSLHRELALKAAEEGVSLNRLVGSRLSRLYSHRSSHFAGSACDCRLFRAHFPPSSLEMWIPSCSASLSPFRSWKRLLSIPSPRPDFSAIGKLLLNDFHSLYTPASSRRGRG